MSFIVTRSRSKLGLGENIAKDPVQSDSQRETVRETPASDSKSFIQVRDEVDPQPIPETPVLSDSGDSLFLTQSVTSPSRTVRRHRPCNDPACPLSQESVDVQEKAGGQNAQHKDTRMSSDSDSEATYAVLLRRWKLLADSRGSFSQPPRPTRKRVSPKWMGVPFLKKSSSVCKKQTIVNSEVGGFFKCMLKLSKGHGDKRRGELSPSLLLSAQEEISMQTEDDDDDDDEDVRKVDLDCFIQNTHKRNQQTWLPSLKWKTRRAPGTCTEKSNKCQEEQETCYQIRKVAEDLMAPQDDTDVYNESSSLNIEVSRSMKKVEKSSKSPEWNWMEPIDEMSDDETQWPKLVDQDEDETQILQDNPTDREGSQDALCLENSSCEHQVQVEDICQGVHHEPLENETQILQDNPTDREGRDDALCLENISSCEHPVQVEDIRQGVHHEPLENETQILQDNPTDREGREDALCLENISFCEHQVQVEHIRQGVHHEPLENETQILQDEMSDDETQWPNLVDQDEDETQILQDNPTDREGSEDALCLENISSCEHQVQVKDIHQCVHHEPLENEDLGNVGGGFIGSQDLFQEPNNQASPLKEISVENDKEVLESRVVPHDDIDLIIQKKKSSLILADMEVDVLKYFKSLRTHPSEIVSPTAGDICQVRQEKDKTTLGMHDPHHHSSLPLEDYKSGSIGNDYSSHSKDILMVRQEEKAETPLFNFGGLKFLKRKYKKTKDPEISDNLAPRLADLGQNEYSALHFDDVKRKNRRKVKNDWLLEEPVDTLPDVSVAADSGLSVQDSSVVCASVSGSKPKKKRKKDKNYGLLEEPVDTLPDVSVAADSGLSVQDSSVVCASVSGSKPKKKRKKDKNYGLLDEPVDTLPDVSVAADSGLSVQDSSVVCASVSGCKPKKKRKKNKNYGLLEEPVDTLPDVSVAADSGLSVQDSSVVCASVSGSKPKKKRKKDKNYGLLEEPVDTLPDVSVAADSGLSVQDSSVVSASVSGSKPKKKRKKDKNYGLLEEPVDTLPDVSVAADSGLSVQDSSVVCASVSGSKPKKKRKKNKNDWLLEEPVDTLPDVSVAADSGLSVQDSSVVCASVSGSKPKKKRKKDKNSGLLEEPVDTLPDVGVAADSGLSVQDSSVVCASVSGSKPKKKRKKVKTDRLLGELVDTLPDVSVAADSGLSVQDSSLVCASLNGIKPKKKRKKDKHGQPAPQEDEWIGVEEAIQIPCQGSASLVSIAEEIKQPIRTDLSNFVQSDCLEPQRKKKRVKKKQDSSPMISDEIVALQCSEESYSSHGIKTVKKKKKTLTDVGEGQIGEMVTATKNIGEPLEKIPEITAGIEIQPVNSINLTDDSVTPRKKRKKRKRQKVVIEENMDVEALLVETTEQVETPDTQDSEQQGAEVVLLRKQKKKKDRTETRQEEEASKNESLSLRLGLVEMTTSNTPSTRSETVGIGEEEGLDGSEPVKKRRELENYGSWSVSHSLLYLDQYRWQNSKQTRMVKEASSSGQNDTNERNKCERTKGDHSESSQQVLQSEDTIQPNGKKKKKKKKKLVETDIEVYPEIVEHEVCQESGSPSETSEAIIEKKKKNRKDTVDRGGNQSLDVVPKLCAAEEPRDVLVTCHAKKDNISSSGGALLVHIKKKKQVRDPDNDLDATLGAEKVAVSGKSNQCSQTHSAKLKKKRKRDHL